MNESARLADHAEQPGVGLIAEADIGVRSDLLGHVAVVGRIEPCIAVVFDLTVVAHRPAGDRSVLGKRRQHAEIDVLGQFGNVFEGLGHGGFLR